MTSSFELTLGHFVTQNAMEDLRYINAVGRKKGTSVYTAVRVCFVISHPANWRQNEASGEVLPLMVGQTI